ncbi:MAG: glucose-6-phosphate isomerase [Saprospiraceae bacterium]|nr:glucose-6-phosphate isomerase [Saprospiraceae bacterium]MCB0544030.1 glucose-6-phosphate isomerase [Saprospiraceae bacterium]MCB9354926.1 glucose-6-phosphate isomerase [Lewinellaceae bacterium]
MIQFDHSPAAPFVSEHEWMAIEPQIAIAAKMLESKSGPGADFLGWLDLPSKYDRQEFRRIKAAAKKIRKEGEVLVVIGIGGSYLGAKAAIEFCRPTPALPQRGGRKKHFDIVFAGTNLSAPYHAQILDAIGDRDFSINVISKSGTTTEPAIAFRLFKQKLEEKYGKDGARQRIYATTDASKGALKTLADNESYETFVVPDNVGGRFSVLTAVGLLPIAAAGIDIDALMRGAAEASKTYKAPLAENPCYQYAAVRNILLRKGKDIELLVNYEPRCHYIAEWWKQLYGESEGKDGKGIFPASVDFSSDLHSMGQYIQDGRRSLFETVLEIEDPETDITLFKTENDLDGLNYLSGKTLDHVNKKAAEGTRLAHTDGGVPNLIIRMPEADAYNLGQLFFFFEKACAVSGYLLGVNPFDQPGVEAYKKNMFALLGKK